MSTFQGKKGRLYTLMPSQNKKDIKYALQGKKGEKVRKGKESLLSYPERESPEPSYPEKEKPDLLNLKGKPHTLFILKGLT